MSPSTFRQAQGFQQSSGRRRRLRRKTGDRRQKTEDRTLTTDCRLFFLRTILMTEENRNSSAWRENMLISRRVLACPLDAGVKLVYIALTDCLLRGARASSWRISTMTALTLSYVGLLKNPSDCPPAGMSLQKQDQSPGAKACDAVASPPPQNPAPPVDRTSTGATHNHAAPVDAADTPRGVNPEVLSPGGDFEGRLPMDGCYCDQRGWDDCPPRDEH